MLVAFSSDAGRTFGAPVEVYAKEMDHAPWASVDVAIDDSGHALVLWLAISGRKEATLNLASVSPDGNRGEELVLAKGPSDRFRGFPQIVPAGDRVAVTWIDGISSRVRAVAVPLASIPTPGSRRPGPIAASSGMSGAHADRSRVDDSVINLEFVSLGGDEVSLASLHGRAVLLNLWATWWAPCIKEMSELAALHERYVTAGLMVVGVSVDEVDDSDKVRRFVSGSQMSTNSQLFKI